MATPDYLLWSTERVLAAVLPLFRRTPGPVGDADIYARYRRTLDTLLADRRAAARSTTLAADLAAVVEGYRTAATDARAVIDGLERAIVATRAHVYVSPDTPLLELQLQHELVLTGLIETLCLAEIAQAVAQVALRSHDESVRLRQRLSRTFDLAIERASERGDIDVLHALRETHAWLVRDLIERGRPLARVVAYQTGVPLPAVVVAHMLYQDAGRAGELMAENAGTDHPGFMPVGGKALSR